ncbi:MAG: GNAT family N-acetyltransferase [Anaerolineales bacterium]|nr:GNAT family N-acetyltransferase [Anaerolineales bacterium]
MKINITQGQLEQIQDCANALLHSDLGREYFGTEEKAFNAVKEGIGKGELYVAVTEPGKCVGFIWFILNGAFHGYPYLHIIAVKEEYRGYGIGQQLLRFFEESVFPVYSKTFLVVADFNPEAKNLYEKIGYQQVGVLPSLYKEGITEYLMMKSKP